VQSSHSTGILGPINRTSALMSGRACCERAYRLGIVSLPAQPSPHALALPTNARPRRARRARAQRVPVKSWPSCSVFADLSGWSDDSLRWLHTLAPVCKGGSARGFAYSSRRRCLDWSGVSKSGIGSKGSAQLPANGRQRLTWTQRRRLNGALRADECNDGGNSAAVIEMGFSLKAMGDRRIAWRQPRTRRG
jgi:hypothetical protein